MKKKTGYWKWWIKNNKAMFTFIIYVITTSLFGFYNLFYVDDVDYTMMFWLVFHPVLTAISFICLGMLLDSYKEYKESSEEE